MPALYIVATPIGNLEDITLRALRILKEVDLVLCEDTRVTKKLFAHYGIQTPLQSYHSHTRFIKIEKFFDLLRDGKNLALVTDSGTPTISDPGSHLVSLVKKEFGDAVSVIPVPGPSALTAALSVSGFSAQEFLFLGFLPRKKGRETAFKEIAITERAIVFYESPHRIMKTLESLKKYLATDRKLVVARELTKMFEQIISGTAEEVFLYFSTNPEKVRGEFVVVIDRL